jgi:hypothetical protein
MVAGVVVLEVVLGDQGGDGGAMGDGGSDRTWNRAPSKAMRSRSMSHGAAPPARRVGPRRGSGGSPKRRAVQTAAVGHQSAAPTAIAAAHWITKAPRGESVPKRR